MGSVPRFRTWRSVLEARQRGVICDLDWQPYYESLTKTDQENYLARWKVPEEWQKFYFDKKWREWLESTDED